MKKNIQINTDKLLISNDVKTLNINNLDDNIFYYNYNISHLLKLEKNNIDKESIEYIGAYSSFVGEIYENIIYELLIRYAKINQEITRFILKGPHQDNQKNIKNGFLIDRKSQIVYKSGYKDISEFDGLFMTKNAIYFVESTIVKDTIGLRKRLKKKKSLLEILFPTTVVRALVIISDEATGVSAFPSYCTLWITNVLDVTSIFYKLKTLNKKDRKPFVQIKHKKMIEVYELERSNFKYFATMNWILRNIKQHKNIPLNINFLKSVALKKYYDIYSKIFVGYTSLKNFIKLYGDIKDNALQEIIKSTIDQERFYVAIEKTHREKYNILFFAKITNGKLKKIEIINDKISISNKNTKGFTYSEVKYLKFILNANHSLSNSDILKIKQQI